MFEIGEVVKVKKILTDPYHLSHRIGIVDSIHKNGFDVCIDFGNEKTFLFEGLLEKIKGR